MRKNSIEPDDGYEFEKDSGAHKTWEEWEAERDAYLDKTYPGLFSMEVTDDK